MVPSRYARGTVLVRSRYTVCSWCGQGTVEVYAHGAVEVRSRYARGVVEVRSGYARGAVEVRSRYGLGAVEVRSWCASGSVRFINFSTGDTVHVRIVHFEGTCVFVHPRTAHTHLTSVHHRVLASASVHLCLCICVRVPGCPSVRLHVHPPFFVSVCVRSRSFS